MVSSVTLVAEIRRLPPLRLGIGLDVVRRFGSFRELQRIKPPLGGITRAGNGHVRRILVESAWQYQRVLGMSKALRARNEGVEPEVRAIAWKAHTAAFAAQEAAESRQAGQPSGDRAGAGAGRFHLGDCPYGGVDGEVTGCFGES